MGIVIVTGITGKQKLTQIDGFIEVDFFIDSEENSVAVLFYYNNESGKESLVWNMVPGTPMLIDGELVSISGCIKIRARHYYYLETLS